jgi:hypothetical protein
MDLGILCRMEAFLRYVALVCEQAGAREQRNWHMEFRRRKQPYQRHLERKTAVAHPKHDS